MPRKVKAKKPDFERELMAGCTTIVLLSFACYALTIWPFFFLPEYTLRGLGTCVAFGAILPAILGVVAIRKLDIVGIAGYLGGTMAGIVFVYLRLSQTMLGLYDESLPMPEYPERWAWLVPLVWVLASIVLALMTYPKERPRGETPNSR